MIMETVDDKLRARCAVEWSKPWRCAVWPNDPTEELPEGCGFRWIEE